MGREKVGYRLRTRRPISTVPRVAGALPERPGHLVLIPHEGGDSASALATQMLLAGSYKRQADASAAMLAANRQPVHVSPPAVPCGDQRAKERTLGAGDKHAARRLGEQPLYILEQVSCSRVRAAGLLP